MNSLFSLELGNEDLWSSHEIMSEKTILRFSGGSPYNRPCHILGYNFIVLSVLDETLYNSPLTDGSITLSSAPCNIRNGIVTYVNQTQNYNFSSFFFYKINHPIHLIFKVGFLLTDKTICNKIGIFRQVL